MSLPNHLKPADDDADQRLADTFGDLALTMLHQSPLTDAWRVNFLANMFVGPIYQEFDARFGLTRPEFVVLFTLSQRPGIVARDICFATGLPKNSISRAVVNLGERGLIVRGPHQGDGRAKRLALTEAGAAMVQATVPLVDARQRAMMAALTPAEKAAFDALLLKLIADIPSWVGRRD